ncbi:hypothetical protein RMSM_06147 [Rhodopirellula maiorica SM1]|uniref:Uncharacterized protein n=1 Tax=Rhodopirellula maiorica SM1 TaxID=1265738 RepID=M5RNG9_9BACT|nr:hypothetical protein RMSM_06147 [Rhodopirellula maiorica SM1]
MHDLTKRFYRIARTIQRDGRRLSRSETRKRFVELNEMQIGSVSRGP